MKLADFLHNPTVSSCQVLTICKVRIKFPEAKRKPWMHFEWLRRDFGPDALTNVPDFKHVSPTVANGPPSALKIWRTLYKPFAELELYFLLALGKIKEPV